METMPGSGPQHSDKASCEHSQRVTFNHHSRGRKSIRHFLWDCGPQIFYTPIVGELMFKCSLKKCIERQLCSVSCAKLWGLKGSWDTASALEECLNPVKDLPGGWSQNTPLWKFKTIYAFLLGAKVTGGACHPELLDSKPGQDKVTDRWPTSHWLSPPPSFPGLFIIPVDTRTR